MCAGWNRRERIVVGGLGLLGLGLPALASDSTKPIGKPANFGKAKNCILLYLSGRPAQLDTFDPKPDGPEDIRGGFKTIPTSLSGVRFMELLPLAATWMH
jgi:hypothetical protein